MPRYGTIIGLSLKHSCRLLLLMLCLEPRLGLAALTDAQRLQQALALVRQNNIDDAIQAIGGLDAPAAITPTLGRLAFLRATLAQQRQDADTARRFFTLVWLIYPPLADYAAWELIQAAAEQDDLPRLQALVTAVAAHYPSSLMRPQSQLLLAQTHYRLEQKAQARHSVERFLDTYPSHHAVPNALLLQAQVAADQGNTRQAAALLQRLGEAYPRHALAAIAFSRSRQLLAQLPASQRPQPDPAHLLATLEPLIETGHWSEVEARLHVLDQLPQAPELAAPSLLARAVMAQHRQRRRQATTLLERWLLQYPQHPQRAEVHYRLGRLFFIQGQEGQSARHYQHASAQHHDTIWAPKALLALARLREHHDDLAAASELYQRLGTTFPDHDAALTSLWRAAWLQYRLGHYAQAIQRWQRLIEQFPNSRRQPQVLYWLARTAQYQGHEAQAEDLYQQILTDYPFHYYSLLARDRLPQAATGQLVVAMPEAAALPWPPHDPVVLPEDVSSPLTPAQYHLRRVHEFQQLQMPAQARAEIDALTRRLPQSHATQYFVAQLMVQNDHHLAAFQLLNRIVDALTPRQVQRLPQAFWTMLYPQGFWDLVTSTAKVHNLSPYLLLSLIRQESAFHTRAVSPAGARGLMQLMPATARLVARQVNIPRFSLRQLFEPQPNIQLGSHYFATQLRDFNDDLVLALAAYNAGPRRVVRWRQRWPNLPMDEFVEHIPFQETRQYVKLILRNLIMYEYLYPPVPDA